jgi:hypothetical protein
MRSFRGAACSAGALVVVLSGCGPAHNPDVDDPGTTFGPSTVQIGQIADIHVDTPCTASNIGAGEYCGTDGKQYDIKMETVHDLGVRTAVTRTLGSKEYAVDVQLDEASTKYLNDLTRDLMNSGAKLAIIADNRVVTAAPVELPIETGQFRVLVPKGQDVGELARQIGGG